MGRKNLVHNFLSFLQERCFTITYRNLALYIDLEKSWDSNSLSLVSYFIFLSKGSIDFVFLFKGPVVLPGFVLELATLFNFQTSWWHALRYTFRLLFQFWKFFLGYSFKCQFCTIDLIQFCDSNCIKCWILLACISFQPLFLWLSCFIFTPFLVSW